MKKALVLLSGGPDSSALAYWANNEGYEVHTINLDFGEKESKAQKQVSELISKRISKSHHYVDFSKSFNDLYSSDDPIHIFRMGEDGPISSVKPFGAGIGLTLAASYALEIGADELFYGIHKDDKIFRENNPMFFNILSQAISLEAGKTFSIKTPFLHLDKFEVFNIGEQLGLDLSETWSCASNSEIQCGYCVPCKNRMDAFKSAEIVDETPYYKESRQTV